MHQLQVYRKKKDKYKIKSTNLGVLHVPLHEVGPPGVADEHAGVGVLVEVEGSVVGLLCGGTGECLHAGRLELRASSRWSRVVPVRGNGEISYVILRPLKSMDERPIKEYHFMFTQKVFRQELIKREQEDH